MKKTCLYRSRVVAFLALLTANCLFLFSCTQLNIFEKDVTIPGYKWESTFTAGGRFIITDTVNNYNIYIVLRHTDAYKYNNIWLNVGLKAPGDSLQYQKVDLELGNDSRGWEGSGMNDIWEVRKILNDKPLPFKKAGSYEFSIAQIMRDNPLLNVMSVGLRLERIKG